MSGRPYSPDGGDRPLLEALEPRLLLSDASWGAYEQPYWLQLPIRSEAESVAGEIGGEGEQWLQGMARSQSNPDILYLSHDVGQIWRSDDNGNTWRKLLCHGMNVIAGQSIEVDPVNPDVVFAVVDDSYNYLVENYQGLYRSTDGGRNWTMVLHPTHDPMVQRMYQHCIAFDPATIGPGGASRWYAAFPANSTETAGTGACLYRSEDYGVTWTKVRDNLTTELGIQTIYEIRTHPTGGNTLYVCTEDGLFVSPDRGVTLTKVTSPSLPSGKAIRSLIVHPTTPTTLYAVVHNDGVYRSTNSGSTWTEWYNYNYAVRAFMNPAYPNVMYVFPNSSTGTNLMVTTNGGTSWTKIPKATPAPGLGRDYKGYFRGDFNVVSPDPRSATGAVAVAQACLWRTTDGIHWADSSTLFTGFAASWCQDSFEFDRFDPSRLLLFCCDVGMVYTDNAGQWFDRSSVRGLYDQGLISWSGMHAGDIQPIQGSQIIVASAGMYWTLKLVRSTDGGATWTVVNNTVENYFFIEFHPDDPDLVFAGDQKSTDAGATWTTIQYLADRGASIFGMCEAQPDTLYAITKDASNHRHQILRSDDRGETWRVYVTASWVFTGMDSKPTFVCDPSDPDVIYTLDSTGDLARYDGTTWTSLNVLDLAGGSAYHNFVRTVAIDPRHPEILYAGMHAAGLEALYRSTDGGATWQSISYNLPQAGASSITVSPYTGDVMYGSCFGTWLFPAPYRDEGSLFYGTALDGDYNGDWKRDAADVDILATALRNGSTHFRYDLSGDGQVGGADLDYLVRNVLQSQYGDSNLDGKVDVLDQAALYSGWRKSGGWARGDFNGDGQADAVDLGILKTYWHWQRPVGGGLGMSQAESGPAPPETPPSERAVSEASSVSAATAPVRDALASPASDGPEAAPAPHAKGMEEPHGPLHAALRQRSDSGFIEPLTSAAQERDTSASEGRDSGVAPPDVAVTRTTCRTLTADVSLCAVRSIGLSPLISALCGFGEENAEADSLVVDLDPLGVLEGLPALHVNVWTGPLRRRPTGRPGVRAQGHFMPCLSPRR